MLGIAKKVEKVRTALHDAFMARAKKLHEESNRATPGERTMLLTRALTLLDIADVLRTVQINEKEIED